MTATTEASGAADSIPSNRDRSTTPWRGGGGWSLASRMSGPALPTAMVLLQARTQTRWMRTAGDALEMPQGARTRGAAPGRRSRARPIIIAAVDDVRPNATDSIMTALDAARSGASAAREKRGSPRVRGGVVGRVAWGLGGT